MVIVAVAYGTVHAEERPAARETGLSAWFKELQKKIDVIAPRKSLSVGTGVAGVRGAKDDNGRSKLYWKGKKAEEPVTEEELNKFKECLAFAEKGDTTAAIKELDEFMKQYPDSALIPDANKSLDLLKAEPWPEPKTEPKADTKTETKAETK
jgi:TolA-binding protein